MKTVGKILVLFLLLIALIMASFLLIFGQGLISGILSASVFTLLCILLFIVGVVGIMKGKVEFFKIRNIWEAVGILSFSIILFLSVFIITAANSFAEFTVEKNGLGYEEKLSLLANAVFQAPLQGDLLKEEKNGVTYYYIEENKNEIEKMDMLLMDRREELNAFFGIKDTGGLAIEFHENYETMEKYVGMKGVSGFYNMLNQTIHLVPTDPIWESVLLHEYIHYQSHLFALENRLNISRLPHWFEEGIADYFAEGDSYWFDLEEIKIVDFQSLDKLDDFDAASTDEYDPYAQSYLAVAVLVEDHGEEVITELLESETTAEFYKLFEEKTGQEIEEFQQTFKDKMLAEQRVMEQNFERIIIAMEAKDYGEANNLLETVKKSGGKYDIEEAYWIMADIYLQQGLFDTAYLLLERKLTQKDSLYMTDDLLMMAEIQLLENPKKALRLMQQAEVEAEKQGETDYYEFDVLIPAYEKVNSSDAASGYKMLLEEGLIYNGFIAGSLKRKWAN